MINISEADKEHVINMLNNGQEVLAIKYLRVTYNIGLSEAKEVVDNIKILYPSNNDRKRNFVKKETNPILIVLAIIGSCLGLCVCVNSCVQTPSNEYVETESVDDEISDEESDITNESKEVESNNKVKKNYSECKTITELVDLYGMYQYEMTLRQVIDAASKLSGDDPVYDSKTNSWVYDPETAAWLNNTMLYMVNIGAHSFVVWNNIPEYEKELTAYLDKNGNVVEIGTPKE